MSTEVTRIYKIKMSTEVTRIYSTGNINCQNAPDCPNSMGVLVTTGSADSQDNFTPLDFVLP